jgi:type I restriction enzyme M protein
LHHGLLGGDTAGFKKEAAAQAKDWGKAARTNAGLSKARKALRPLAEQCRDLTKQIDLAAKLAGRVIDIAVKELEARESDLWDNTGITRSRKALESARAEAVEKLRKPRYFIKQADWLQERFPDAELRDVEGLIKLVSQTDLRAHDWSLTPGRYVGVAPEDVDENFDFEETLRSIHIDLRGLNEEAVELAARIAQSFEELGV